MQCSVCLSCESGAALLAALQLDGLAVSGVDCMSGCTRASTVAFRAAGKTVYLFGDLTVADVAELRGFAIAYAASSDGNFSDARGLGALRLKALARIPG